MDPNQSVHVVTPPGQQEINPAKYHFSAEELRALRECNVESFYQRSLPIGTGLGLAAWTAVKKGILKGSPKYGPIPKVALGVVIGYFVGKFSYQSKCAEKIMRLPNSQLGEMLRKRRKGGFTEGFSMDPSVTFGMAPGGASESAPDNSFNRQTTLDMDVSRPTMSGLDDTYRPNLDSTTNFDDNLPLLDPPKNGTSYDELRKAHREEYQRRMNAGQPNQAPPQRFPGNNPAQPMSPQQQQQPQQQHDEPSVATRAQQKNKYGDVWT